MSIRETVKCGEISYDRECFLVKVTTPKVTEADLAELLDAISVVYAALDNPFDFVLDLYDYKSMPMSTSCYTSIIATFDKYHVVTEKLLRSTTIIIPSYLLQKSITYFFYYYRPLKPVYAYCNRDKLPQLRCSA